MITEIILAVALHGSQADVLQAKADSLHNLWKIKWKQSDSIRVESMLLRMRSDSLKKVVLAMKAAPPPSKSSDTITANVMSAEPDSGSASYYADAFHGRKTSSGELYNMDSLTCAHRWLPFGTRIRVTNVSNGKTTIVRVNDRGPWKHGRIVDVSRAAAKELDLIRNGTAPVKVSVVEDPIKAEEEDD